MLLWLQVRFCRTSVYVAGLPAVVRDYRQIQRQSTDTAVAVAAIKALTNVIVRSQATTMMGLGKELEEAANSLIGCALPTFLLHLINLFSFFPHPSNTGPWTSAGIYFLRVWQTGHALEPWLEYTISMRCWRLHDKNLHEGHCQANTRCPAPGDRLLSFLQIADSDF